ncbi:MAG: hypothetical protein JNL44_15785 [Gemmatimonadetes bacterium]|nr:hypothetical protein [Gemmatimonadota bacterium]
MPDLRVNAWRRLRYLEPTRVLVALRTVEKALAGEPIDEKVARLRTANLKPERESRDAALLTCGLRARLGVPVYYAPVEDSDHDFVVRIDAATGQFFTPVQLKELVPNDLNPDASLEQLVAQLRKRHAATDTVLAIRLNRNGRTDLSPTLFEDLPYSEVWLFWAASPDAQDWRLYGNMRAAPVLTEYQYPTATP